MATKVMMNSASDLLHARVAEWERRARLVQIVAWLPRWIATGLVAGIVLAVLSRLRPWLLAREVLLATCLAVAFVTALGIAIVWLYPRKPLESARRFDRLFGLRERTTAALELLDGMIPSNDELRERQIEDALTQVEGVRARALLPFSHRLREWGLLLPLIGVFALLVLLPNPQASAAAEEEAQAAAIAEAAETVREILRDTAVNPNLDEASLQALLEVMNTSLAVLDQPGVSPEEAFAALTDVENALREQSGMLSQQATAAQAGLQAAAQALRELPSVAQQESAASLSDVLAQMGVQAGDFREAERSTAAQALNNAAQELQGINPQAAQSMRDAAQSLQQGQTGEAQAQLQQASQAAQQASQTQQTQQNAAQQLSQSAQQAQQAGQQVSEQQSGQQGQPQTGQQGSESQQGQQPGDGAAGQPQSQPGREGEPEAQGQGSADAGQQPGQGEASSGQQTQGQGEGQSAQAGQQAGQASSASAGAGDQAAAGAVQGAAAGQQEVGQNNADGQGRGTFETIYAPTRLGNTTPGEEVRLETDQSQMPVQEGNFTQNPSGQASVPYNQVFAEYASSASRALESGYVPLGMRDVIRDYFTGLEPGR